ncbi:MAG: hypothetical protein GX813_00255 [Erysipelotrichia bacterium]|nr:hypothetical protein [Erysipelotrichia bacterium]
MIIMFIALYIVVMSCNLFVMSYQMNGINRLVTGIPMSIFETAVVLYGLSPEEKPYFDKEILEDNIWDYFDCSLPRYSETYEIAISYYDLVSHAISFSDKPEATQIKITTVLDFSFCYQKTMHYEIR